MAQSTHNVTFKKSCETISDGADPCAKLDARFIEDTSRKSSEWASPCPDKRYLIYVSNHDTPVSFSGVNCEIIKVGPSNVPTKMTVLEGQVATPTSDPSDNILQPGERPSVLDATPTLIGSITVVKSSSSSSSFDDLCTTDKSISDLAPSETVYATYLEVKNGSKDIAFDIPDIGSWITRTNSSGIADLSSFLPKESDIMQEKGLVGACQEGCITTYDITTKRCTENLCFNCQECCESDVYHGVHASDISLSSGQTLNVFLGGCPPYSISFLNYSNVDVTDTQVITSELNGTIEAYPAGWKESTKNVVDPKTAEVTTVDDSHQMDGFEKSKYITLKASDPICGSIFYKITDACGNESNIAKIDCNCCQRDPVDDIGWVGSCFTNMNPPHGLGDAKKIPLTVLGTPPFHWSVIEGEGSISDKYDHFDTNTATASFKAGKCGFHKVQARDSCGNDTNIPIQCAEVNCCPVDIPTEWDKDTSANTIKSSDNVLVCVKGALASAGSTDFVWSLSGDGYTFVNGVTTATGSSCQIIHSSSTACGACEITVVDACNETVNGSLRNVDNGHWIQAEGYIAAHPPSLVVTYFPMCTGGVSGSSHVLSSGKYQCSIGAGWCGYYYDGCHGQGCGYGPEFQSAVLTYPGAMAAIAGAYNVCGFRYYWPQHVWSGSCGHWPGPIPTNPGSPYWLDTFIHESNCQEWVC